jgi:hypothetical protein
MDKIKIQRISAQELDINQRIVKGLKDALADYKAEKLTARMVKHIQKYLPETDFRVWMGASRYSISKGYDINVCLARGGADVFGVDYDRYNNHTAYLVEFHDTVDNENWDKSIEKDWRAEFMHRINRFDQLDTWQWEQNREPYLDQFAALEQAAADIKAKAEALLASIPAPAYDPLKRWSWKSDYALQKAFPNAFQYKH